MGAKVTFGIDYTFENPPGPWFKPWDEFYDAVLEQIEWLDRELAIDGVYVSEHHFYEDGYLPAPLLMCGVLARRTSRVQLGTDILQLPLHHPVRVAEESLIVDILSKGRLRLGLGLGYYHQEMDGLGSSVKERAARTEEGIDILRAAFAGESFARPDHKHHPLPELRVSPPAIRPGGPPIWIGAFAPKAIERAARLADGFFGFAASTVADYFAACERIGKPVEEQRLNRTYWALIGEDPEKVFAEAGAHWMYLFNEYINREAYFGLEPFDDPKKALAAAEEGGFMLVADGPTAVKQFNQAIAEGAYDISLVTFMPGEDCDQVSQRLEYLSREVIPNVDECEHPAALAAQAAREARR